jgi:hypothetical protein
MSADRRNLSELRGKGLLFQGLKTLVGEAQQAIAADGVQNLTQVASAQGFRGINP